MVRKTFFKDDPIPIIYIVVMTRNEVHIGQSALGLFTFVHLGPLYYAMENIEEWTRLATV